MRGSHVHRVPPASKNASSFSPPYANATVPAGVWRLARQFSCEDSAADDAVAMNNTVTVFSEKTGREITFRIVTTIRANPIKRLISIESPIGKAIYGRRVGERRLVETETGETYYVEIRSIDKTTDDTEDEISRLAVVCPNIRLCIIRDYEVVEKKEVQLPDTLENVVKCANPVCISNNEPMRSFFYVTDKENGIMRCHYCNKEKKKKKAEFYKQLILNI